MKRIIGESTSLVETLDHVSRIAAIDRPVLVVGERGSGKEMVAERLHFLSTRWDKALYKVNCAAISEQLLDSELFGHETGAFTGATKRHIGRFERADGGTLFLDELATLPLRIQEKLLRIIEYGEFERLGGQTTVSVDVRIVAATNEHLPRLADQGKFRHDLLDRLAFDVVRVPPLRERLEDIPTLAEHFAFAMCVELGQEAHAGFSESAMQALLDHHWPGNIRELKNAVERSMCHWPEKELPIDTVIIDPFAGCLAPIETTGDNPTDAVAEPAINLNAPAVEATEKGINFSQLVQAYEVKLIRHALHYCRNHQKRSAAYLGLTYHQFRAMLRKYGSALQRQSDEC